MVRRGTKPPPKGKAPPKFLNPGRAAGVPLTLAEVESIGASFAALRSERAVEKALGFPRNTIRRYLHKGDPSRGIRPLVEGLPPLPAQPVEGPPPELPDAMHAPVGAEGVPDDAPAASQEPAQAPAPSPVDATPPAPPAAPARPLRAPAPPPAAAAPPAPPPPPAVPGVGAPLPAAPAPAADPTKKGIASVQHTVAVANNELARLSRNTRALYDLRQRTLTTMVSNASKRAASGDTSRMSRGEREMLMLLREARVRPVEMLALHRVEVGILGVGEGKAAADNIDATDETRSIEDLQAELRGLLDERKNLLGDDDDPALASSRGPVRTVNMNGDPDDGG